MKTGKYKYVNCYIVIQTLRVQKYLFQIKNDYDFKNMK